MAHHGEKIKDAGRNDGIFALLDIEDGKRRDGVADHQSAY
jgi:hypothetical protein